MQVIRYLVVAPKMVEERLKRAFVPEVNVSKMPEQSNLCRTHSFGDPPRLPSSEDWVIVAVLLGLGAETVVLASFLYECHALIGVTSEASECWLWDSGRREQRCQHLASQACAAKGDAGVPERSRCSPRSSWYGAQQTGRQIPIVVGQCPPQHSSNFLG